MKRCAALMFLLLLLTGCGRSEMLAVEEPTQENLPAAVVTAPTEADTLPQITDPVEVLLSSMTLEEKVGQLFVARYPANSAPEDAAAYHLGGYILFGRDFESKTAEEIREQVNSCQSAAGIPLLMGVDEEGGTVVRVSSQFLLRDTPFLSPQQLYAQGGMDRILEDTIEKDGLLSSLGINVNFAPVADVSADPENYIHDRTFGQNAEATAEYTALTVAQMARDNMGSVLKHFPGYGPNADTHTGIAVDERPMETFRQEDLLPFKSFAAGEGKTAIMVSHNIVNCMDPERPASLSGEVHRFLRREFGFDGVIMTDALDMDAVQTYADGDVAVAALEAGNDILLICDYKTGIPAILEAVADGTLTETVIDTACRRVLLWKQALGLL